MIVSQGYSSKVQTKLSKNNPSGLIALQSSTVLQVYHAVFVCGHKRLCSASCWICIFQGKTQQTGFFFRLH